MPQKINNTKKAVVYFATAFQIFITLLCVNFYLVIEISNPTATIHVYLL